MLWKFGGFVLFVIALGGLPQRATAIDQVIDAQDRLTAVADEITARAAPGSGYGSIRLAPEHNAMTVYWKGPALPTDVERVVREGRESGLTVDVRPAAYTSEELEAETARIAELSAPAETGGGVPAVAVVGPLADASGIRVSVTGTRAEALESPAIRESTIPITIVEGARIVDAGRFNDIAPFYGGGNYHVLNTPTAGKQCSTGFAIQTELAENMMLTAAHCVKTHQIAKTEKGTVLGEVVERFPAADLALIRAHSAGRVWIGSWNNSTESKPVVGVSSNIAGQYVCTNGASTGTWCGLNGGVRISATGQRVWSADLGLYVTNVVEAFDENDGALAGQGDSGGSVIQPKPGWTGVVAKGIVSQFSWDGQGGFCNGDKDPGRKCGSTVYYETIFRATSTYGPIVTG